MNRSHAREGGDARSAVAFFAAGAGLVIALAATLWVLLLRPDATVTTAAITGPVVRDLAEPSGSGPALRHGDTVLDPAPRSTGARSKRSAVTPTAGGSAEAGEASPTAEETTPAEPSRSARPSRRPTPSPSPEPPEPSPSLGPPVFGDCGALRSAYPNGVGRSEAVDRPQNGTEPATSFTVDDTVATANAGLDSDGDGVVCEQS